MILVCGEALMDVFVTHQQHQPITSQWVAGGSAFNVARALGALGRPVALLAGLSQDHLGEALRDSLAGSGVSLSYTITKPQQTTLALIQHDEAGGHSFAFYGGGADVQLTPADLPSHLPGTVTALALGSYSLFAKPIGEALRRLVERESIQRLISIDLNVRTAIIGPLATWVEPFDHFLAHAHIVKASLEDVQQAYGEDADLHSVAGQWLLRGVPLVLMTLGAKGAIAFFQGDVLSVPSVLVDVVDTVGAGDVFHAGFLAWFDARNRLSLGAMADWTRDDVVQAMHHAANLAARVCSVRGCEVSILAGHPISIPQVLISQVPIPKVPIPKVPVAGSA